MPEQEQQPTEEYPKDEKELIIRQWERVFRAGSFAMNPRGALDYVEIALSDKIDDPNDGTWKKELENNDKEMHDAIRKLASKLGREIDDLHDMERLPIEDKYTKRRSRILWRLTEVKGTFGVREVDGVISEYDDKILQKIIEEEKKMKINARNKTTV